MRSRSLLLAGVLALAGCQDRTTEQTYDPPPAGPGPRTTPAGGPAAAGSLQGAVGGKPFVPDAVVLEGRGLSFRKGKDFFADMEIRFDVPEGKLEGREWRFEGDKFENPTVLVSEKNAAPQFNFPKDYTLALKITRETPAAVEGTIDLKANQPAGTHLRGAFTATRKKTGSEPLEAADAPYVHGKVAIVGPWTRENLSVGFVGKGADGKQHSNMAGTVVTFDGGSSVTSTTFDPQLTGLTGGPKGAVAYRHTRVPPGEYLVYAKRNGVMAAWQTVTVKPGDERAVDLTIDPARAGEVVVTLPDAEAADKSDRPLALRPVDLPADADPFDFAFNAAEVKAGQKTVTVKGVPAGKYRVTRGQSTGEVEVPAGKSVAVTLVRDETKK